MVRFTLEQLTEQYNCWELRHQEEINAVFIVSHFKFPTWVQRLLIFFKFIIKLCSHWLPIPLPHPYSHLLKDFRFIFGKIAFKSFWNIWRDSTKMSFDINKHLQWVSFSNKPLSISSKSATTGRWNEFGIPLTQKWLSLFNQHLWHNIFNNNLYDVL